MTRLWLCIILLISSTIPCLAALNVKVKEVDRKKGRVSLLLPMHSAMIQAQVYPAGESVRVKPNQFYEGNILTTDDPKSKFNVLRLKIPHSKPLKFLIKRIEFIIP